MGVPKAIVVAVVAICCFSTPAAAVGLEPGVHIDPGSPAAKEYALPLNQARQTGSGSRKGPAAPFGIGIHSGGKPASRSAARGVHVQRARGRATPVNARRPSGSPKAPIAPAAVLRASGEHGSSGGTGSTLALLGGAVAVLVLGGFGGVVLRRSHRVNADL
jgi:hypothetical protein